MGKDTLLSMGFTDERCSLLKRRKCEILMLRLQFDNVRVTRVTERVIFDGR